MRLCGDMWAGDAEIHADQADFRSEGGLEPFRATYV